nr:substrate-binding domain-containing protein [Sansalvadorimonas sp. 2012CJ34-2]
MTDVSISTVSHVINGTRFVSHAATERVHATIKQLGYKPSAVARSLKTNRTRTIGMLTSSNTNPFFAEVIHGVEATCNERGYHLILSNSGDDTEKKIENLKTLEEKRVDGLLIMTAHSEPEFFQLLQDCSESPMVILDCQSPGIKADIIMEDPEAGGYEATRYLIDQGFADIACISGPQHLSPSNGRFAGYHRAMKEAGLRVTPSWVIQGELNAESGYQATKQLMKGVKEGNGEMPSR